MIRCPICTAIYERRGIGAGCSPICKLEIKRQKVRKKAERDSFRARKLAVKSRSQWMSEAQAAVNAWIRLVRDKSLPCISCGISNPVQWHAGHFLSRGAHPELALEPRNLAKQCSQCNDYLSGNQLEFERGLVYRHGQAEVDWLRGPHEQKKYTVDDLIAITRDYKRRVKIELG